MGNIVAQGFWRRMIFRPSDRQHANLPFGVRSVGHHRVPMRWRADPWKKDSTQLFWGIEGEGNISLGKKDRILRPGHVLFYFPGDVHRPEALSQAWRYRWFAIDGPLAESIPSSFGFSTRDFYAGQCPETLFTQLEVSIGDPTARGQLLASTLAYTILGEAANKAGIPDISDKLTESCAVFIRENCSDPGLGISGIADHFKIHRSTLCRNFRRAMGMSPMEFLTSCRIQKGLLLLGEAKLPISEIAERCGYSNPNYFTKAIRKKLGHPPRKFRISA